MSLSTFLRVSLEDSLFMPIEFPPLKIFDSSRDSSHFDATDDKFVSFDFQASSRSKSSTAGGSKLMKGGGNT